MNPLSDTIYNCRKATFLIEKKQLIALTMKEHIALRIHLTGCSMCRLFQKQSLFISSMIRQGMHINKAKPAKLDDAFKTALQKKIDEKLEQP